jgi:uncharacterized surface protein with fasciclin (FAS1) repeats
MRSRRGFTSGAVILSLLAAASCGDDSKQGATADTVVVSTVQPAAKSATTVGAAAVPLTEVPGTAPPVIVPADIVDTAVAAGSFTTLTRLLTEAGLVETLKGAGPFTVFAPTDAAFAAVPPEVLQLLSANQGLLSEVLTYHVVSGELRAADLVVGAVKSVQGEQVEYALVDGSPTVNGAPIITADIATSNGVIHAIDAVLIPQSVADAIAGFGAPPVTDPPATPRTTAPKPRTTPAPPATDGPPRTDGPPSTEAPPDTEAPHSTEAVQEG